MGRKREQRPELALPDKFDISSWHFSHLVSRQEAGEAFYGSVPLLREHLNPRLFQAPRADPPGQTLPAPTVFNPTIMHPYATTAGVGPSLPAPLSGAAAFSSNSGYHAEEDALIMQARELGKSWAEIAGMLPGRSSTAIRKRYTSLLKPKASASAKAREEPAEARQRQPSPAPAAASRAAGTAAPGERMQGGAGPAPAAKPGTAARRGSSNGPGASTGSGSASDSATRGAGQETRRTKTPERGRPPQKLRGAGAAAGKEGTPQKPAGSQDRREEPLERCGVVEVDRRAPGRSGGDARVRLTRPMDVAPPHNSVLAAHGLGSLAGVRFYRAVSVVDPDDARKAYGFDLDGHPAHGACFHVGAGPDGTPLISWSDLRALYQLSDGSKWAEHGFFHDAEDLEDMARRKGVRWAPFGAGHSQELFRKAGRYHSRLQNIEYECWVFKDALPKPASLAELGVDEGDAYFWRLTFDPDTLQLL